MKIKLFCLLASLVTFVGCEAIKDLATVSFTTELKTDIPIVITSDGIKSSDNLVFNAPVIFSKTEDLYIGDNVDISPYLAKVKEINLSDIVITVTGLTEGQTINSVSLDITGIGNIITKTGITMTNNSFSPTLPDGILDKVAAKLLADKKVTLTVYGSVSEPMSINVGLKMDAQVVAYVLDL